MKRLLRTELGHLIQSNPSDRLWQMLLAAALAMDLPLLAGAYTQHLDYRLFAAIGGLLFLYLPDTSLSHRVVWLMACGFGIATCLALGAISHFFPPMIVAGLTFIAILMNLVRFTLQPDLIAVPRETMSS